MAAYKLSNFYEQVRALAGDDGDLATGYDYTEEQLEAALRTVVRTGFLHCLAVDPLDNSQLIAPPPNQDTWGYLAAKAAHILIGGEMPVSIRTRAMSVMTDPAARRDSLAYLESMLSEIDARGNLCGSATDIGNQGLFGTAADRVTITRIGGCLLP